MCWWALLGTTDTTVISKKTKMSILGEFTF